MCLILFALNPDPDYRLVIAANRDESHDRASLPATFWDQHPYLLAGRDLRAGGTWLGITRSGRFAAVTNFRETEPNLTADRSRGDLPLEYLLAKATPEEYLQGLTKRHDQFRGFNLLVGELDKVRLCYYSNQEGRLHRLPGGTYGLSNQFLNCDWSKVRLGRERLQQLVKRSICPEMLLELLQSKGEDALEGTSSHTSSLFISGQHYGTVASTVLLVDRAGLVQFVERRYSNLGTVTEETSFSFRIEPGRHG